MRGPFSRSRPSTAASTATSGTGSTAAAAQRLARKGEIPAKTPLAESISRDLKKRGFTFVGPTIVYAYLQSTGVVNDHIVTCFRYGEVQAPG